MMYKIEVDDFEALRLTVGNICTENEGQPCEELHGTAHELKVGGQIMAVHAVDEAGDSIISDDTEITKVGGEAIADYEQWKEDNVKPEEELP